MSGLKPIMYESNAAIRKSKIPLHSKKQNSISGIVKPNPQIYCFNIITCHRKNLSPWIGKKR